MRVLRPSGADTWMRCKGQPALVEALGLESTDSVYAAEGRAAHALAAKCLLEDTRASDYLGHALIEVNETSGEHHTFNVDETFARYVDDYIEGVERAAHGADDLLVEQRIDLSRILKVDNQGGTADAVILHPTMLEVRDLKFGQGIPVYVQRNRQLLLYASGVWLAHKAGRDVDRLKLVVHQPRLDHLDEWTVSVKGLKKFIAIAREAAAVAMSCKPGEHLNPGEEQCYWCPAKAQCPALTGKVVKLVGPDTKVQKIKKGKKAGQLEKVVALPHVYDEQALAQLGRKRSMVPLVEMWVKAVTGTTKDFLARGLEIPGWKLVDGRKGARCWTDEDEAAEKLKAMRLSDDEIYNKKLISPTQVEGLITEGQYTRLVEEGFIDQPDGAPTVAPESSKKEAINAGVEFDNLD